MVTNLDLQKAVRSDWVNHNKLRELEESELINLRDLLNALIELQTKIVDIRNRKAFNKYDRKIFLSELERINKEVNQIQLFSENELKLSKLSISEKYIYKKYLRNVYSEYNKLDNDRKVILKKKQAIWLNVKRMLKILLTGGMKKAVHNVGATTWNSISFPVILTAVIGSDGVYSGDGSFAEIRRYRKMFPKYLSSIIFQIEQLERLDREEIGFEKEFLELDFKEERVISK